MLKRRAVLEMLNPFFLMFRNISADCKLQVDKHVDCSRCGTNAPPETYGLSKLRRNEAKRQEWREDVKKNREKLEPPPPLPLGPPPSDPPPPPPLPAGPPPEIPAPPALDVDWLSFPLPPPFHTYFKK